ncbi:helix-turn-helix transcriptional regulator [Oceanobacillus sp. FSL K6-0118]|uniref:helix-turn-helix domain-containing protein n=1 Tax=Oceanobacillus sp. FSL K6-0118 TaxID=2921418 RepID=UPI0030F58D69
MKKKRGVPSEFAITMERYRMKKGISSNKLADAVGVSASYLCRIKNGQRKNPSVPIAMNIAEELDIPTEHILAMLGVYEEEVKDLFDLISSNEVSFEGQLIESMVKESVVDILKTILPDIMRGEIQ